MSVADDAPIDYQLTDHAYAALTPTDDQPRHVWSAATAAEILARDGRPLDQARADVAHYLDRASADLDVPVHGWGLDEADISAIRGERLPLTCCIPSPRRPVDDADAARRRQLTQWHADDSTVADVDGLTREERS